MTEMIALITQFSGLGQDMLWVGFLVFLRVGAAMALVPAFGEQAVPQRVKLVLTLAFTAVVAPAVNPDVLAVKPGSITPLLTEVISGLLIGIGLRFFVHALQTAGSIIAQATTLSQLFAGTGPEPQPAIGNLLVMAGLALAVMAGLHVHFAELLILSYEPLPVGQFPGASDMADWGLFQIARAFSLAFSLAAPFVVASFIYNVAIGVINRAMPSLMVSLIGAPALAAGGLLLLAVVTPLALAVWLTALEGYVADPFQVAP
jgi:flagellar biosynthesis protein FliR